MFSSDKVSFEGRAVIPGKKDRKSVEQMTAKAVRLRELCHEWEIRRQKRRLDRRKLIEERNKFDPLRSRAVKRKTRQATPLESEVKNKTTTTGTVEGTIRHRNREDILPERVLSECQTAKQPGIKAEVHSLEEQKTQGETIARRKRKLHDNPCSEGNPLQVRITSCYSLSAPENDQQANRAGTVSGTSSLGFFNAILSAQVIPQSATGVSGAAQSSVRTPNVVPMMINPGTQQLAYRYWPQPIARAGAAVPVRFTMAQERPVAPNACTPTCTVDIVSSRAPISHAYEASATPNPNASLLGNDSVRFKEQPLNSPPVPVYLKKEPSSPDVVKVSVASGAPSSSHAQTRLELNKNETGMTSLRSKPSLIGARAKLVPREIMSSASIDSDKFVRMELICDKELTEWTAQNVADFIAATDCAANAQDFVDQEVDGKAVLLLTQEILMKGMDLRLGPAVKLYSHICNLRSAMAKPAHNSRLPDTPKTSL